MEKFIDCEGNLVIGNFSISKIDSGNDMEISIDADLLAYKYINVEEAKAIIEFLQLQIKDI